MSYVFCKDIFLFLVFFLSNALYLFADCDSNCLQCMGELKAYTINEKEILEIKNDIKIYEKETEKRKLNKRDYVVYSYVFLLPNYELLLKRIMHLITICFEISYHKKECFSELDYWLIEREKIKKRYLFLKKELSNSQKDKKYSLR